MFVCKYCRKDKLIEYLECVGCGECIHLQCLRGCSVPGGLLGDVFFVYTCQDCSASGTDCLERDKIAWVDLLLLTLYNLSHLCPDQSVYGYFHCNKHIKKFVNTHWATLFPHMKTKRKSWKQMITTTLKSFSPEYFLCGDGLYDFPSSLTGWYKLARPDILPNQAFNDRKSKRKKRRIEPEISNFSYFSEESVWCESSGHETDQSTPGLSSLNIYYSDSSSAHENMYSRSYVKPTASLSENLFAEDDKTDEIDVEITDSESAADMKIKDEFKSSFDTVKDYKNGENLIKSCPIKKEPDFDDETILDPEWKSESEDDAVSLTALNSLFIRNEKSNYKPWVRSPPQLPNCRIMNEKEELYLKSNLSKKIFNGDAVSLADIRLHRKLRVRQLRREKIIPVFDFCNQNQNSLKHIKEYRVLDRYQHQTIICSVEEERQMSFRTRLLGSSEQYTCFVSPFTQSLKDVIGYHCEVKSTLQNLDLKPVHCTLLLNFRVLKPFIRRDYESKPLWLKLLKELKGKINKKVENSLSTPGAPIDYCYVRPQHIPAINSLAQQYFWPGINLSECLQYPDFSCVVLYKKLIVAFAFLVPDVRVNEAYISFIFTRPEWRRAGIGTFMLYHLIQTCMGRDITLHVSATNPALFLYQKFGFKVEEFVQDFYDRYLPVDSNECKHALFLRLSR